MNPAIHFYQALILDNLGCSDQSERSFRQAIYLDRSFALAHYHLGLALKRDRQMLAACRSFGNVLRVLPGVADQCSGSRWTWANGERAEGTRRDASENLGRIMREAMGSTDVKGGEGSSHTAIHSHQQRMEAVWRARAKRLSQRPDATADGQNVLPVIVLRIGKERYGVDLSDVAEVLPPVRATPVPGAPAVFAGVINVHGEIRPVIDLRRLLGIETAPNRDLARVIYCARIAARWGYR